jgi:hypothetical protein
MIYWRNLYLWLTGFGRFDRIRFKPGWSNDWRWKCLYAIDYGAAVILLGIGVQPVSRWAYERRGDQPWRWLNARLDALDEGHGENSGGLLWGSQPCERTVRYGVMAAWAAVVLWLIF